MQTHTTHRARQVLAGAFLGILGTLGTLTWSSPTWASTRLSPDIEIQAWYRMRHTFQTDTDHFEWVQWRNEGFIWLTYENFYKKGKLFDRLNLPLPLVDKVSLSARWRSRVDPVFAIRGHFKKLYDEEHQSNFLVPENGFRDVYADIEHGYIGPGKLYTRWGYQQIVWGESDLFRSIDIVNPLRVDQNFGVGENLTNFGAQFWPSKPYMILATSGAGSREQALRGFTLHASGRGQQTCWLKMPGGFNSKSAGVKTRITQDD